MPYGGVPGDQQVPTCLGVEMGTEAGSTLAVPLSFAFTSREVYTHVQMLEQQNDCSQTQISRYTFSPLSRHIFLPVLRRPYPG